MFTIDRWLKYLPGPIRGLVEEMAKGQSDTAKSQRGAFAAFLIRVASAAIAFLSQVLLARWIGAHEYGIFTYVWVWINVIGTLCAAGFATSVMRFIPEYASHHDFDHVRGYLRAGRAFSTLAGLVSTISGLLILYYFDDFVEDYYRIPFAIALLCVPAFALTDFQDGLGRAQGWLDLALIPPYIFRPVLLFVFIGGAVLIGWSRDAETAVISVVAATWITAAAQYLLQKKRMREAVPSGPRSYKIGFWLKVSLPVIALESFAMMMTNLDILILNYFVNPDQIAIYYAAVRTIALIAFVHFSVTAAVTSKFVPYYTKGDMDGLKAFFVETRKWTFLPSLIGAVILLALGKPLLWLFGPEFTASYPVMFVMVIGLLTRALAGPLQGLMIATGQQNGAALALGVAVVFNVALNFLLIPKFGLLGAGTATAISYCIESLLLYLQSKRLFSQSGHPIKVKEINGSAAE